jgi:hypothetical protein
MWYLNEVLAPRQESEKVMYLWVRGIDFASFYDLIFDFRNVPTVWYVLFFIFYMCKYYLFKALSAGMATQV